MTQINEKEYDTELVDEGIDKDHIVHYGFAFEGKKVLILADKRPKDLWRRLLSLIC